ncbi:oligosaccharide flippase family protein [Pseudoalteromonas sp. T1lg75]|uniref:oligosaccharide flippase family protein n=1 Tax=Pseudoalteromonas sp. T1lg75 TaxID=2077102 RepID=UPI000CF60280|nr:oligosaccharide flippase family protein [Pseudoalteromonas sp. T1lg75]
MLKNNIKNLAITQFFNFIAPLLLLPLITRTLTFSEFGLYAVLLSATQVWFVLSDFGFSVKRVQLLAKGVLSKNSVLSKTTIIVLFNTCLLAPLAYFLLIAKVPLLFIFLVFITVIFQHFQFISVFHGLQKMQCSKWVTLTTRISFMVLVFFFYLSSTLNFERLLLSYSLANFLGALLAFYFIKNQFSSCFSFCLRGVLRFYKVSFQYFLSRCSSLFYTQSNSLVLSQFISPAIVALYSAPERLYQAGQGMSAIFSQALFPYVSKNKSMKPFAMLLFFSLPLLLTGLLVTYLFGGDVLAWFFGEEYRKAEGVFFVLMCALCFHFYSAIFGFPIFNLLNKLKYANYTLHIGVFSFFLSLLITFTFSTVSPEKFAICVLIAEGVTLLSRLLFLMRCKVRYDR